MRYYRPVLLFVILNVVIVVSTTVAVGQVQRSRGDDRPRGAFGADRATSELAEPSGETRQAIALTLWTLTITDAEGPEADELEGALRDKAKSLSGNVGSVGDVRELVGKLKVAGLLKKYREIRLMTVDGQVAAAQAGADQPSIVGTNFSDRGNTNVLQMRAVGTIVRAIPRRDTEGNIQVGLDYSCSSVTKSDRVNIAEMADSKPLAADVVTNTQVSTLVSIAPGEAVVVSGDATVDATGDETQLIILAAEIVE
jgi:hypothetical protein